MMLPPPKTQAKLQLMDLPPELLLHILGNLDYRGLLTCSSVCKAFKQLIDEHAEFQLTIELAADGLEEGSDAMSFTSTNLLSALLERRRAWEDLKWKHRYTVEMPGPCMAYELVAGTFAKTMPAAHLTSIDLPSISRPEPKVLEREDLGLDARDFAIDPTQDLIAFVDDASGGARGPLRIHLRTISSNTQHPEAVNPILETARHSGRVSNSFIQIVVDIMGIFTFEIGNPNVKIWNWRTGNVLVDCSGENLPPGTWDCSFLSARAFVLTSVNDSGAMHIYSFTSPPSSPSPPPPPVLHATLCLPPLQEGVRLAHLATHTGPFHANPPKGSLFTTSPASRIHVVSVQYVGDQTGMPMNRPRFMFFFHNHTALKYLVDNINGPTEAAEIPWDAWGPKATRFLVHHIPFMWLRYVHGQRVICPPMTSEENGLSLTMMQVIDFNVHPSRHPSSSNSTPPVITHSIPGSRKNALITAPTVIPVKAIFRNPVITYLPYRSLYVISKRRYSGFMIDDERIVGLFSTAFSDGDMRHIDVHVF